MDKIGEMDKIAYLIISYSKKSVSLQKFINELS